jgi:hypothetical protein
MLSKLLIKSPLAFNMWAAIAAFITYFSMYAFRKPFSAATYNELDLWGIDYKIVLIIAQVLGYMCSKFTGIKLIAELKPNKRIGFLLLLIGIAQSALLLFALTPHPYNFAWLFVNGLPLGMVWGIVFSYLEGRKFTELLGAALSASFIISSGAVKSTGRWLIVDYGISDFWMPFITGLLYLPALILGAYMLMQIPKPTTEDIDLRSERRPMERKDRIVFFKTYATGLTLLIIIYMTMTAYRDFRDNFAVEIWQGLGYIGQPEVLTLSELPIAIATLIIVGLLVLVKNNKRALGINYISIIAGGLIAATATVLLQYKLISPMAWMISIGFGLYLGYIMFNTMLFDRLIAYLKEHANVGFLIYLADSFGYLGSVTLLLYKNFGAPTVNWLPFSIQLTYVFAFATAIPAIASWIYFGKVKRV